MSRFLDLQDRFLNPIILRTATLFYGLHIFGLLLFTAVIWFSFPDAFNPETENWLARRIISYTNLGVAVLAAWISLNYKKRIQLGLKITQADFRFLLSRAKIGLIILFTVMAILNEFTFDRILDSFVSGDLRPFKPRRMVILSVAYGWMTWGFFSSLRRR